MFAALMNVLSNGMLKPLVTVAMANSRGLKKRVSSSASKDVASSLNKHLDVFESGDDVGGVVSIRCGRGELRHEGIFVDLVGSVKGEERVCTDFMRIRQQLKSPSQSPVPVDGQGLIELSFVFGDVSFEYASYEGVSVCLCYSLQVFINGGVVCEQDIWIADQEGAEEREFERQLAQWAFISKPLDAGVPSFLHIRMHLDQSVVGRESVISGSLQFLLVRVGIVDVSLFFVRKEELLTSSPSGGGGGGGGSEKMEEEEDGMEFSSGNVLSQRILMKRQICDGRARKGDDLQFSLDFHQSFPIDREPWLISRMNLAQTFAVKHYIGIVLRDDQGRRYFKQQQVLVRPCRDGGNAVWSISLASSI